eukprot:5156212-Amphidinium_carterae.1
MFSFSERQGHAFWVPQRTISDVVETISRNLHMFPANAPQVVRSAFHQHNTALVAQIVCNAFGATVCRLNW